MAEGGEKVVAEFQNVRHKKQDGVLLFTSARVAWSSDEQLQVNYSYPHIKAQRISPDSSSKIRLQLMLHAGSPINFHFTGENALEQRNQAKQLLQQLLSRASLQVNPDLEAKSSLLNNDPGLYQLYKDLVGEGLITSEEFWANRLSKQEPEGSYEQESGLPSAFLADVQAVTDGCNAVKYSITADVIQAIFKTYPSVKTKHAELVPDKMSEEDFWVQFFQSQLFHRDTSSSSSKDVFTDCLVKEHTSMLGGYDGGQDILQNTTAESLGEGYSVFAEVSNSPSPQQLVQRCNHHSTMVLSALSNSSSSSPTEVSYPTVVSSVTNLALSPRDAEFPQVTRETGSPSSSTDQALKLKESQHQLPSTTTPNSLFMLATQLSSWTVQQSVDTVAAQSAIGHLVPGSALMPSGTSSAAKGSVLSKDQRESIFRHQAAVSELLRHFWACFPPLSPQLEEKFHQMGKSLKDYHESRLSELSSSLGSDDRGTVDHLSACIGVALEKYCSWQSRTKGKVSL